MFTPLWKWGIETSLRDGDKNFVVDILTCNKLRRYDASLVLTQVERLFKGHTRLTP